MPFADVTLRRRMAAGFCVCGILLMLCGLYMVFVRGVVVDVVALTNQGAANARYYHYALALNPFQPELWQHYHDVAPVELRSLIDQVVFQFKVSGYTARQGSFFVAGAIYLFFGAGFLYCGLLVMRLFYARAEAQEDKGAARNPLDFLLQAHAHKYQQMVQGFAVFPDRLVAYALVAFIAYGVFSFYGFFVRQDGFMQGSLAEALRIYFAGNPLGGEFRLRSDPFYLQAVQGVAAFLVSGCLFFWSQTVSQFSALRGIFVAVLGCVFFSWAAWCFFVRGIGAFAAEFADGYFAFVAAFVASLCVLLRFLQRAFKLRGVQQICALAGVFAILTMLAMLLLHAFVAVYFYWTGLAFVGAVSGFLYRPRQKNFRFYQ